MRSGKSLTVGQVADLSSMLAKAEEQSGLAFDLYVGAWEGGREGALRMLGEMADPDRSVVIAVDPEGRQLEIVTGRLARIALDDRACGLAGLSMTSSFAADDLMGGLRDGLSVLGEQGRRQRVVWVDQP